MQIKPGQMWSFTKNHVPFWANDGIYAEYGDMFIVSEIRNHSNFVQGQIWQIIMFDGHISFLWEQEILACKYLVE